MRTVTLLTNLLLLGGGLFVASAQDPKAARAPASVRESVGDERAVREAGAAFVKAFDAGDAKAIAAQFTEDGQIVSKDGIVHRGRAAAEAQFVATFVQFPGASITALIDSIRFLSPDVALEEGKATLTPKTEGVAPLIGRYSVIYVRQDGKWLQSIVRDELSNDKPLSPHDHIAELAWMVGDWVNESASSIVFTSCDWADNKNFLLRTFTVQIAGKPAMSGTQRIGWDPLTKQIKSWVFDSEGGHGEGLWTRDGKRWIVKAHGVLPDGRVATATHIVTPVNKDEVRWESVDRTAGSEDVAETDAYTLVRKPPKPR
jgi:uncharacterized protein (TIGR02246 family)